MFNEKVINPNIIVDAGEQFLVALYLGCTLESSLKWVWFRTFRKSAEKSKVNMCVPSPTKKTVRFICQGPIPKSIYGWESTKILNNGFGDEKCLAFNLFYSLLSCLILSPANRRRIVVVYEDIANQDLHLRLCILIAEDWRYLCHFIYSFILHKCHLVRLHINSRVSKL